MSNVYVNASNSPLISDFDPATMAGIPTEAQIGIGKRPNLNLHSPITNDPTNYFIFDALGNDPIDNPTVYNPGRAYWMTHHPGPYGRNDGRIWNGNDETFVGSEEKHSPGNDAPFNEFNNYGYKIDSYKFYETGGPRNLGYMDIQNQGWLRINNEIDRGTTIEGTDWPTIKNEAWYQGAIELTIKPNKNNCTILSGANFAVPKDLPGGLRTENQEGRSIGLRSLFVGQVDQVDASQSKSVNVEIASENGFGFGEEAAIPGGYLLEEGSFTPDPEKGLDLRANNNHTKYFGLKIENNKIKVIYEVFHGQAKKYVEVVGTTNVLDGNWHHIVINRPSQYTKKSSEQEYGGKGCLEIWVDGKLDKRSYDITTYDALPTPQVLFNDAINPAILNYRTVFKPEWFDSYINSTQYTGGIREYVLRQSFALTPHMINLNYNYAILNGPGSKIIKAKKATVTAKIIEPTISVNKKNILKLYWNNLINDKEKMLNGLEFDDNFNVYSYSMTHKNLISSTQTFNLDINDEKNDRFYFENVKTAINEFIYLSGPGMNLFSTVSYTNTQYKVPGFSSPKQMMDLTNNQQISVENLPFTYPINNILYGGSKLNAGDRILLLKQYNPNENGIWIFNGPSLGLTRPLDYTALNLYNAHVYVTDGKYAGKTFVQTEKVTNSRKDKQTWREISTESSLSTINSFPIHTTSWTNEIGDERFIDINEDIDIDFDVITFMNYPSESKDILNSLQTLNDVQTLEKYKDFIESLKIAVTNGKSLYISSPLLAVDFNIVNKVTYVDQLLQDSDAQSASISPFESGEPASYYYDTHRNIKYHLSTPVTGLTNKETYIMTDFVTYSPNKTNSDYHIKYAYRQFGLQEGDEFYIPGLTTLPETINEQLPGYLSNQKNIQNLPVFDEADINYGTTVTKLSNNIYNGSTLIANPYDDYATTIIANYGLGKIFLNCVENGYAFSRLDYNKGRIQNVTIGQNAETVQTAAWQYSTKRLNKKNLYDFSDDANAIGQTIPTTGGGGGIVQSQSHCSNGMIRVKTNKDDLRYQSDLYPDYTEEVFSTTEIPVLSMTWLGLQWLAS
jgi:hypothetical protein